MMKCLGLLGLLAISSGAFKGVLGDNNTTPIVIWHGMGDSCCFPFSIGSIVTRLNESLSGAHILSLQIGDSLVSDMENSYLLHPDKQIVIACDIIQKDPLLADGFNALGFSQGGQFLRALVQRCPSAKVKNLISLGGQHQGVYGIPNCGSLSMVLCDFVRDTLNEAAYESWVQETLTQATYWHDPLDEPKYRNGSTFLADINNEITINKDYITRLQTIQNLVLVKFEDDTMVWPVDSEWFGFYKPGQEKEVQTLQESTLYTEDRLGLQQLDKDGRIHFLSTPGGHLKFTWEWFEENVLEPFLRK